MILCIDIGTSVLKAGLFDRGARLLRQEGCEVPRAATGGSGAYEIEPESWIRAFESALAGLPRRQLRRTGAVVISGNGPTIVPLDARGRALHPAVTWMDHRGVEESGEIIRRRRIRVDPSFFLAKAYWFRRHRPDLYEKTGCFLGCPEFLARHLCGTSVAILPNERFQPYYWTREALEALDMDPDLFPPFVPTGETIGGLRRDLAAELDLPADVPIVAGGPDYLMSLLGTGVIEPGLTCDRAGTSEGINHCSTRFVDDSRLLSLPHIVGDHYSVAGVISTSGKAIQWFRAFSGYGSDVERFFRDVGEAEAGAGRLVFLPYLAGERSPVWDPDARGVFAGLALGHSRREMARAVAESVGFAMRDIVEVIEEHGFSAGDLRVAGGLSRVPILNRIKADITGRRMLLPEVAESELMGDACVGLVVLGEHASPAEASSACVRIGGTVDPDATKRALYDELFGVYRSLYRSMKPLFRELRAVEAGRLDPGGGISYP